MRLLDLFCGAGGAAMGYYQAGFAEIVGVDIEPQPNYPFAFVQADALEMLPLIYGFDAVHASPPCQHHTRYRNAVKDITDRYDDLCEPVQGMLALAHIAYGVPGVVENVEGSHLHADLKLCGSMFGLDVRRHRDFQLIGWDAMSPPCNHKFWTERKYKSSTGRKNLRFTCEIGAWDEPLDVQKAAMGVDHDIEVRELSQAIPPAYTKYIGEQFLAQAAV